MTIVKSLYILCLSLLPISNAWSQNDTVPGKKELKVAEGIWGKEISIDLIDISDFHPADEGLTNERDQIFSVSDPSGHSGYIFMTSAMGRFEYFDYSIFCSSEPEIIKVMVTTYRSSRGAAICSKHWLKQFEGYRGEKIKVGDEIDAISGATISAHSITEDIQRCYKLILSLGIPGSSM